MILHLVHEQHASKKTSAATKQCTSSSTHSVLLLGLLLVVLLLGRISAIATLSLLRIVTLLLLLLRISAIALLRTRATSLAHQLAEETALAATGGLIAWRQLLLAVGRGRGSLSVGRGILSILGSSTCCSYTCTCALVVSVCCAATTLSASILFLLQLSGVSLVVSDIGLGAVRVVRTVAALFGSRGSRIVVIVRRWGSSRRAVSWGWIDGLGGSVPLRLLGVKVHVEPFFVLLYAVLEDAAKLRQINDAHHSTALSSLLELWVVEDPISMFSQQYSRKARRGWPRLPVPKEEHSRP